MANSRRFSATFLEEGGANIPLVNELLLRVECGSLGVDDILKDPPSFTGEDGTAYLIDPDLTATGAWVGREEHIAIEVAGAWEFIPQSSAGNPARGLMIHVEDDNTLLLRTSGDWVGVWGHQTGSIASGVVTWNTLRGTTYQLTLTANVTDFQVPLHIAPGQELNLIVQQDATGGRTVVFNTAFEFAGGVYVPSAAANAKDCITFVVQTTSIIVEKSRAVLLS